MSKLYINSASKGIQEKAVGGVFDGPQVISWKIFLPDRPR